MSINLSELDSVFSSTILYDEVEYIKPLYSKNQVSLAGDVLIGKPSAMSTGEALAIINNRRSSHSYPLQVITMALRERAKKVDEHAVIAQRLKRLSSIESKLKRFDGMKLARMQDLGGCRAILKDVKAVYELADIYDITAEKNPTQGRPQRLRVYDYIDTPKDNGYRSLHYSYEYRTNAANLAIYNGLHVEVQIRSRLQHYWATAVETVSAFTDQALKSDIGEESWKRFFALAGSLFARMEQHPLVPGTPEDENVLLRELLSYWVDLDVENLLGNYSAVVSGVTELETGAHTFLLVLNARTREVDITGFTKRELPAASEEYLRLEKLHANDDDTQTVLVSVDSLAKLKSAYPNYYLDTRSFILSVKSKLRKIHGIE